MDLSGKKILVAGLGKTGVALCKFLAPRGALVTVTDTAPAAALEPALAEVRELVADLELGQAQPTGWKEAELIIPSPGVPLELPWLQQAIAAGIPLLGELELASRFLTRPVLAVTGTNGKTTTTTLVAEMLRASGKRVLLGGNIGTPLVELLAFQDDADCLVVEVSSFQLDTAWSFRPWGAALLNICADHLDRYPNFAAYAASKAGLFRLQGPDEVAVLNGDDPWIEPLAARVRSRVYTFSARQVLEHGAWINNGAIQVRLASELEACFPLEKLGLKGQHNQENIMAALLLALEAGASPESAAEVLARFPGLPHRLEWVATIDGVRFFDDSKGTNVGAVVRALSYFSEPVILIAGGRDKGGDYGPLVPVVQDRVKTLILVGEAQEELAAALAHLVPTRRAADLPQAVAWAWEAAHPGDVVLLSPACSSFDMFKDYAERGRVFQAAVRELSRDRQIRASG